MWLSRTVTPRLLQRAHRPWRRARAGSSLEHPVARLDEQDLRPRGRFQRTEVATLRVVRDLADLPGHLDTGRSGTDEHERHQRGAALGIGLELGGLESASSTLRLVVQRSLQRLQIGRRPLPLVVAEVVVARAARPRSACRRGSPRGAPHSPAIGPSSTSRALEIEPGDLGERNADVAPAGGKLPTQRVDRSPLGDATGRDLVGQRLEQVEVAPVDERNLDRHSRKLQRGLEASEAAADDDYSMWFLFCGHDWESASFQPSSEASALLTVSSSGPSIGGVDFWRFRWRIAISTTCARPSPSEGRRPVRPPCWSAVVNPSTRLAGCGIRACLKPRIGGCSGGTPISTATTTSSRL